MHRIRRSIYFPGMLKEARDYIDTCPTCQAKKKKGKEQRHTLVAPIMGYPFQRLHLDYQGPITEDIQTGAKHILTCRDSFSKWVEAFPMVNATAPATVRLLEKEIFSRYGIPESIHSDCGTQFKSRLFTEVGKALGINITDTTLYNPKGNGQVERMHKDLNSMLLAMVMDDPEFWEDALPASLFALDRLWGIFGVVVVCVRLPGCIPLIHPLAWTGLCPFPAGQTVVPLRRASLQSVYQDYLCRAFSPLYAGHDADHDLIYRVGVDCPQP